MTRPKPLQEFIDVLGRCDDLFNVIDLAVLARRDGAAFSVLSVRLTVGRIDARPKPKALIRPDWFAIRQFRSIADYYPLIGKIVAGWGLDRLFKSQSGPLLFSRPPQGWFSNGMNPRPTLFRSNGTIYQIGASWGALFSTPEEFRVWQNDVNASDDVHDVAALVQEYGFRQPCSQSDHHRQLHIEMEFPIYFSAAESGNNMTRLEFSAPACDVSSWKIKWRSNTNSGASVLKRMSDGTVVATINGSYPELQVTPVLCGYALPEFRPPVTTKDKGHDGEFLQSSATIITETLAEASPSSNRPERSARDSHGQDDQHNSYRENEPLSPRPLMKKHFILFLAANPSGTDPRVLDREARAIQVELERSGFRDRFQLVTRWAAEPLDLLRELRKLKPTVVHFSGHGGSDAASENHSGSASGRDVIGEPGLNGSEPRHGLFFQGLDGRPQFVSTAALQQTFGAAGASVKLIVLNACYSEVQATALLAHVDCIVGMRSSIRDDVARSFAIGFYGGLGERESVAAAYKQGRAAISLEGLPDSDRPQLKVRTGVDATQIVLAADLQ